MQDDLQRKYTGVPLTYMTEPPQREACRQLVKRSRFLFIYHRHAHLSICPGARPSGRAPRFLVPVRAEIIAQTAKPFNNPPGERK